MESSLSSNQLQLAILVAGKFFFENASNSMITLKGVCVLQRFRRAVNVITCLNAGQVITASIADIIENYSFKDILRKLAREKQTQVAPTSNDDSYLGEITQETFVSSKDKHIKYVGIVYSSVTWYYFGISYMFSFLISLDGLLTFLSFDSAMMYNLHDLTAIL